MKAAIYTRISTGEQSKYSLKSQEQQIKDYCKKNNYSIYKTYQDVKGRFTFEKREGLMKLLDDVEKGKIDIVLVTEQDRLTGDQSVFGYIKYTLKKFNVKLIAITEQNKVKSEYEELIEGILTQVAKFENQRKKLRCRRGIERAKAEGKILNKAPYGYKVINKGKKDSYLAIDEDKAKIIKDIFNLYGNKNKSIYSIAKYYNLSESNVKYFLGNKFYADKNFNGYHKPIISWRLFNKVNNK